MAMLDYIPPIMREYAEMREILETEDVEVQHLKEGLSDIWKNQFLQTSTHDGVRRWEKMLGITPKSTDTLEERKFRIYALLNQELPYTMTKLVENLTNLCGVGGFTITLNAASYTITIVLALGNKNNYGEVEKILAKMLPANIVQIISIMYNTHEILSDYTHSQLGAYTHYDLRNEVMTE